MRSRLPSLEKSFRKILYPRYIITLVMFVISPFLFLYLLNTFILKGNTAPISIQEFYLSKNEGKPNLFIKVRNSSSHDELLRAYLKLDDKLNNIKKQIDLGDLGIVQAETEKGFTLIWNDNWEGSGLGDINLTIKNQEGIITDKSIFLAVIPSSVASVEMFTFLASVLVGSGLIISRFT